MDYIFFISFLIVALVLCVFLAKFSKMEITVSVKQEFNEADRQLLEDLYNKDGDLKSADNTPSFDDIVKDINSLMLDQEDRS